MLGAGGCVPHGARPPFFIWFFTCLSVTMRYIRYMEQSDKTIKKSGPEDRALQGCTPSASPNHAEARLTAPMSFGRICPGCGELMDPRRSNHRVCSVRCRVRVYRRRRIERFDLGSASPELPFEFQKEPV